MSTKMNITVLDVARYIIELATNFGEPVTNMKLQKLLFYSYVWYLVHEKKKLFSEPITAWQYGPVISQAYDAYKKYGAEPIKEPADGDSSKLDEEQKAIIEDVFNIYGSMNGIELAMLTHSERPWLVAFEPGKHNPISDDVMFEFYKEKLKRMENDEQEPTETTKTK